MAKKVAKVAKVVKECKGGLTEQSTPTDVVNYIKSKNEGISVIENELVSVKKLSKRLFNYKVVGDNRVKVIFRNAIYKAYFDPDTKFTTTLVKERGYNKYSTTLTKEGFAGFVDKLFAVEVDTLCETRLENRGI